MLVLKKKMTVVIAIITVAYIGIAATNPQPLQPRPWKNLKVLSPTLSHDSLDHLMDEYKFALGVKCGYCHAKGLDNKMNMASDDNPRKDITRRMIQMTDEMNAKYLHSIQRLSTDTTALQLVTCNTCHRGVAKPVVATMPLKNR